MATDQPTQQGNADATAARLRQTVVDHFRDDVIGEKYIAEYDLDTLIGHLRSAGAVEALAAVRCRWAIDRTRIGDDEYECLQSDTGHPSAYCDRCKALAAAQERLAAYAKEDR